MSFEFSLPALSDVESVKKHCEGIFDSFAMKVRTATERVKQYMVCDGHYDVHDLKEIVRMGTSQLRDLRLRLDDAENAAVASLLTSSRNRLIT